MSCLYLHSGFYSDLSACESSVDKVCRCFLRNNQAFFSYIAYVGNMAQGLGVLSQYGGTFFEGRTKQQLRCRVGRQYSDSISVLEYCS